MATPEELDSAASSDRNEEDLQAAQSRREIPEFRALKQLVNNLFPVRRNRSFALHFQINLGRGLGRTSNDELDALKDGISTHRNLRKKIQEGAEVTGQVDYKRPVSGDGTNDFVEITLVPEILKEE